MLPSIPFLPSQCLAQTGLRSPQSFSPMAESPVLFRDSAAVYRLNFPSPQSHLHYYTLQISQQFARGLCEVEKNNMHCQTPACSKPSFPRKWESWSNILQLIKYAPQDPCSRLLLLGSADYHCAFAQAGRDDVKGGLLFLQAFCFLDS
jgi:hypothetical protein